MLNWRASWLLEPQLQTLHAMWAIKKNKKFLPFRLIYFFKKTPATWHFVANIVLWATKLGEPLELTAKVICKVNQHRVHKRGNYRRFLRVWVFIITLRHGIGGGQN